MSTCTRYAVGFSVFSWDWGWEVGGKSWVKPRKVVSTICKRKSKEYSRFIFGEKTVANLQFSTPDNVVCTGIKWPVYKQLVVVVCEACTTTDRL